MGAPRNILKLWRKRCQIYTDLLYQSHSLEDEKLMDSKEKANPEPRENEINCGKSQFKCCSYIQKK